MKLQIINCVNLVLYIDQSVMLISIYYITVIMYFNPIISALQYYVSSCVLIMSSLCFITKFENMDLKWDVWD